VKRATSKPDHCLKKFLGFFRKGFYDQKYIDWERGYKWDAHLRWVEALNKNKFQELIRKEKFADIAAHAVRIESRTNLLFSFEKMALRDAVKEKDGARLFAQGLFNFIHGKGSPERRFDSFLEAVDRLPRKQTRVRTWPLLTVFGFIAAPDEHIFLKPRVTQAAAEAYGYNFKYHSKPNWETYRSLLDFAGQIREDFPELKPRDYIDLQSFIWVLGSSEYD
jgi:hypothetical protein